MSRPRVLIIDDDAEMVSLVQEELARHGFEVTPWRPAVEAGERPFASGQAIARRPAPEAASLRHPVILFALVSPSAVGSARPKARRGTTALQSARGST